MKEHGEVTIAQVECVNGKIGPELVALYRANGIRCPCCGESNDILVVQLMGVNEKECTPSLEADHLCWCNCGEGFKLSSFC